MGPDMRKNLELLAGLVGTASQLQQHFTRGGTVKHDFKRSRVEFFLLHASNGPLTSPIDEYSAPDEDLGVPH